MKRTISIMSGEGVVNHNLRIYHAENTDPERSHLNIHYCHTNIRKVYHQLFDRALQKYNSRQKRSDRIIKDYYKKICMGEQEKPFYEIIVQIGNHENMNAQSEDGKLAAKMLDEYMQGFRSRNPQLHVFSAHLHMDEATPHLHIDFVPFTTGSKRGLETRVSLKKALETQGFIGTGRQDTERSRWVLSEKEQLAAVMERYGIEWEKKDTHEEHLNVLDFKKKMRMQEVAELEQAIDEKQEEYGTAIDSLKKVYDRIQTLQDQEQLIEKETIQYDQPEWNLPEPSALMSAKSYKEKQAQPLIAKLKKALKAAVSRYHALVGQLSGLQRSLSKANASIDNLTELVYEERRISSGLKEKLQDYKLLRRFLGEDKVNSMLEQARTELEEQKRKKRTQNMNYER